MTYNVFSGTLNPTHFTSLTFAVGIATLTRYPENSSGPAVPIPGTKIT